MTLREWHLFIKEALSKAGVDHASQEAKWLLVGALGQDASFLLLQPSYTPSVSEERKLHEWIERRVKGEPLSRLKGMREFWSLPFHLNEDTLDPRPETEAVIDGVLTWVGPQTTYPWHILDLGTGSGCLLITLLHELKHAIGTGIDISEKALAMAHENAILNGVDGRATFLKGNWGKNVDGPFDIIVSNPPYIPLAEKKILSKGVLDYDPPQALFGGEDGLACYRILSKDSKSLLSPKGLAILEIGWNQRRAVEALFQEAGFKILFTLKDLAGHDRAVGIIPS